MHKFMSYLSNRLSTQVLSFLWSKLIKIGIHQRLGLLIYYERYVIRYGILEKRLKPMRYVIL